MITKQQLLDSIVHELNVIKHLYSKLDVATINEAPGENMRTTLELMQYLTFCGIAPAKAFVTDNWDLVRAYREESVNVNPDNFLAAIDKEIEDITALFDELTDAMLLSREVSYPWGGGEKLGMALIDTTLKFLTAYRMQFFLYIKGAGASELNTGNCWRGMDMPMPAR